MQVIRSPYQGLIPFNEVDAAFFFGRGREVRQIINHLFASPLVVLYGANGVGKSSVLRAGVVRVMSERDDLIVAHFNSWAYSDPLAGLNVAIREAIERATGKPFDDAPTGLADLLSKFSEQTDRRFIIILDQFEEFFLYHTFDGSGAPFASEFASAVWRRDLPVSFLVSVREDSLGKLDYFQERIPQLLDSRLRLDYMDRLAAGEAIRRPLDVYNQHVAESDPPLSIEDELVDAVLHQISSGGIAVDDGSPTPSGPSFGVGERIETPFLQMVMTRLWEMELARGSHILRLRTFQELGGAEQIARSHLDSALAQLSRKERDDAASIVRFLVTPSGTKIAQNVESLASWSELHHLRVRKVLEKLSTSRILRTIAPPPGESEPRYEIFHDVLAPAFLEWGRRYQIERRSAIKVRRSASITIFSAIMLILMFGLTWYAYKQRRLAEEYAEKLRIQAAQLERLAEEEQKRRHVAEAEKDIAQAQKDMAQAKARKSARKK